MSELSNYSAILRLTSNATNSVVNINMEGTSIINSVKNGVAGKESIFTMQVGPNPIISAGTLSYSVNGAASRNIKIDLVNSQVYACGSNNMIKSAKELLLKNNLKESNFFSDAFVQTN